MENNEPNIIEALDSVQFEAHKSRLSDKFWDTCTEEIDYLCKRLEMNRRQVVILAVMSEIGEAVSWRRLGDFLGLSRLKTMSFTPDMEDLRNRRWVYSCAAQERNGRFDGFRLAFGVIKALRHNRKFEPEKLDGLTEQAFIDRLNRYLLCEGQDCDVPSEENRRWILSFAEQNTHLPLCKQVQELGEDESKALLLLLVSDYTRYAGSDSEGFTAANLRSWYEPSWEFDNMVEELREGTHILFNLGLVDFGFQEGMVDNQVFRLTEKAKRELVGRYRFHDSAKQKDVMAGRDIVKSSQIVEKQLFYNEGEQRQIARLGALLDGGGLSNVQQRLAESGLRRGITCLFYGAPGTGKTESVYQLARRTGRDIITVNIAGLRDKYVGESEKNIHEVFSRYKELCSNNDNIPILLFNEADAIIGNRFENTNTSVEKMDNAMQNIILQEIENLDGILVATTNLTCNLDKAFDRRFLFKVEFAKPCAEAKKSIWHSMLPEIPEADCAALAAEFDFSGGQIENIARKCKIEYAISGVMPPIDSIREFCREEHLNRNSRSKVGF